MLTRFSNFVKTYRTIITPITAIVFVTLCILSVSYTRKNDKEKYHTGDIRKFTYKEKEYSAAFLKDMEEEYKHQATLGLPPIHYNTP